MRSYKDSELTVQLGNDILLISLLGRVTRNSSFGQQPKEFAYQYAESASVHQFPYCFGVDGSAVRPSDPPIEKVNEKGSPHLFLKHFQGHVDFKCSEVRNKGLGMEK